MANKNSPLKDFHQINTKEEKLAFQKAVEAIYNEKGKLPDRWFFIKKDEKIYFVEQNNGKKRLANLHICTTCDRQFAIRLSEKGNNYCSIECKAKKKYNQSMFNCSWCKKELYRKKSHIEKCKSKFFFCSNDCKNKANKLEGGIKEIWPKHFGKANKENKALKYKEYYKKRKINISYKRALNNSNIKTCNKIEIIGSFSYVYFSDCKKCKKPFTKKHSLICYCTSCTLEYTTIYRKACKFNLNNRDHAHLYNSELIKKYGFYAPKNSTKPNLNGLSWDHLFRIEEGFKLSIPPEIMNHPANAELIPHGINQKRRKSMISYDELVLRIQEYDKGNLNLNYFFKDTYESN